MGGQILLSEIGNDQAVARFLPFGSRISTRACRLQQLTRLLARFFR